MLICKTCGAEFNETKFITEAHGFELPPYEKIAVCPFCNSSSVEEKAVTHCRCCGARLELNENGYCSAACKEKGEKLRLKELKRKQERFNSPINEILRKCDEYNRQNKTHYSYGQYVALILPNSRGKKCKKKRNT